MIGLPSILSYAIPYVEFLGPWHLSFQTRTHEPNRRPWSCR